MDTLRIYIDLDETLISSIPGYPGMGMNPKSVKFSAGTKDNGKPDTYHAQIRPAAQEMLAALRNLAPTFLMTVAMREYAEAANQACNLMFQSHEIIAREDYTQGFVSGWGSEETMLTMVNIYPHSILIDNNPPENPHAQDKRKVLGIGRDHYFKIRDYMGGKDPEKFLQEWKIIMQSIQKIQKETQRPMELC